jgi:hypothetical protein
MPGLWCFRLRPDLDSFENRFRPMDYGFPLTGWKALSVVLSKAQPPGATGFHGGVTPVP